MDSPFEPQKRAARLGAGVLAALASIGIGCQVDAPRTAPTAPPSARNVVERYEAHESQRLAPMLLEVLGFATYGGNEPAHAAQKRWLAETGAALGFVVRDTGPVVEIELPGPRGAEVLGLVVHGDVVEVDAARWSFPPFEPRVENGMIQGRGAADDKGPLVQALLAMKALEQSGIERKKTIRLLVGTDEESGSTDVTAYLQEHRAPELSLVLDSAFPVVVGEKAWNALAVSGANGAQQGAQPWQVTHLEAGLATSIVPDVASATLGWRQGAADWAPLIERLRARPLPEGIRLDIAPAGTSLTVTVHGRAAHAGVNLVGGRNALVALANLLDGELPAGTPSCLLAFAKMAGHDLSGTGLGITDQDPIWGRYDVNVATVKPTEDGAGLVLTINVRRIPPRTGPALEQHLREVVAAFETRTGCALDADGFFGDEPLVFDTASPAIQRLLAAYERGTGERATPVVSGGGTYAKRIPDAIAFGMWFPGKPYPGHDVDETAPVADLHRGARVLIEVLVDLVSSDEPLPELRRK